MGTVMVVDDERKLQAFLERMLVAEGHAVVTSENGLEALERLARSEVDLLLLDLMLPGCSGLAVLGELRNRPNAPPVIMLSAVEEVGARVQAFERGAADFVVKPFHVAELMARVRRQLSSGPAKATQHSERYLELNGVRLDLDRRHAVFRGVDAVLSGREFELLAHLMRRGGEVCGKGELLHDVWGLSFDPGSNVVEVCVRRLRAKVDEIPLETVRGVGYCFQEG